MRRIGLVAQAFNIIFVLNFLCAELSFALDPHKMVTQYVQDIWQTDNGLPQNTVFCITQTKDGFLWLGTEEGLARFDGVRFTVFNKGNTPEIKSNFLSALFEDGEGNLWIATYGGGLTKYKNGQFVHYGIEQGLPDDHIVCLYQDQESILWIGTTHGLSRLNHGRFESFSSDQGLLDNWIVSLTGDHTGGIWIGTAKGLCRWQNEKIKSIPIAGKEVIFSLYCPSTEDLWIGSFKALKHLFRNHLVSYNLNTETPNIPIRRIYQDRDGNLWIATEGAGLNRFYDDKFEALTTKEGFPTDMVHALYEDREGSLWIGTSSGLSRLKSGKLLSYSTTEGLSHNLVWCIHEDSQGQVWIGTEGGGLNLFHNGKFSNFTIKNGLSSNLISSLAEDPDGRLWIGTLGGGLNCLNHGKFIRYTSNNGLAGNWIWAIHPDRQGSIWISTFNRGLSELKNGTFTTYNTENGFPSNSVHSIWEAPDGTLYFATVGAGLVESKDGKITTFSTKQGLASNDLLSIYGDSEGTLWIATLNQGLIRFKDGRSTNFTQKDGLLDDTIQGILEDNHRNLWMSTNRGIFTVKKKILEDFISGKIHSFEITTFGKSDGMKSEECNGGYQPSAWKSRDGRLWFPTTKGVVIIDPEKIPMNPLSPQVKIQEILVDNQSIPESSGSLTPIVFQPGKERFEFHYTALSFLDPNKVRFKYKLEGFDRDWVNPGTQRVAYYTHLPPGFYQFKVQACNNDGLWNEAGAALQFRLRPHFYQTGWFYLLCALAAISAALALHRFRLSQIQGRFNAILSERNRLARELHDTLAQGMTGIISQLEAAEEVHTSSPDRTINHVTRARDLARQNLNEARRVIRAMRSQYLESGNFVSALGRMATDLTADTTIEFDIRIDGEERIIPALVEDHLLRIAQESITNSLKYANAKFLCIELRFRMNSVELFISDDGIGFDVEKGAEKEGHFGLLGIKERAKQLGGEARIRSSVGKGTEILVSVPIA